MSKKSPNYYQIIFYYFYKSQVYFSGGIGTPLSGTAGISGLVIINLGSLFLFLSPFIGIKNYNRDVTVILAATIGIIINVINYYYLVAKGRYIQLEREMEGLTEEQKKIGRRISLIYTVLSVLILIAAMIYLYYIYR
jgi:hypothetical protein